MERTARDILDSPQSLTKISILVMNISVKETLKKSIIWIFFLFKGFFFSGSDSKAIWRIYKRSQNL